MPMTSCSRIFIFGLMCATAFAGNLLEIQPRAQVHVSHLVIAVGEVWAPDKVSLEFEVESMDPQVPLKLQAEGSNTDFIEVPDFKTPEVKAIARIANRDVTELMHKHGLDDILWGNASDPGQISDELRRCGSGDIRAMVKEGLLSAGALRPQWTLSRQVKMTLPPGKSHAVRLRLDPGWKESLFHDWSALAGSLPENVKQGTLWQWIEKAASELPPPDTRLHQPSISTFMIDTGFWKGAGKEPDSIEVRWLSEGSYPLLGGVKGTAMGGVFRGSMKAVGAPQGPIHFYWIMP
jgi:hypothetical protein